MPKGQGESHTVYRPDIDGLRALAILTVVAYHASLPGFSGGYVGVDIFFVISGFLITKLLVEEYDRNHKIDFISFYARRFKRLMPAFLAVIVVTVAMVLFFVPGLADSTRFANSFKWTGIGFANLFFKKNTGGYFDGPAEEMPFLHFWSLAVEEQFYLVWPWLIAKIPRTRLFSVLALISIASISYSIHLMTHDQLSSAFYLMPPRAWELGVGSMIALLHPDWLRNLPIRIMNILAMFSVMILGAVVVFYDHSTDFPGLYAIPPVWATGILILAGQHSQIGISKFFTNRIWIRIGLLSYGWYLWHWPFLVLLKLSNLGQPTPILQRLVAILVALFMAKLSLEWVEAPVRNGRFWKLISNRKIVIIGLLVNLSIGTFGFIYPKMEDYFLGSQVGHDLIERVRERSVLGDRCFTKDEVGQSHCSRNYVKSVSEKREILIWGDSHSGSYFLLIDRLAEDHLIKATQYCQGQTLPLASEKQNDFSSAVLKNIESKVLSGQKLSLILVARWVAYRNKNPISIETRNFPQRPDLEIALNQTLKKLRDLGVGRILILLPNPEFKFATLRCQFKHPSRCFTERRELDDYQLETVSLLKRVAQSHADVRVLNPVDVECGQEVCLQVKDGVPIVSDSNHPTVMAVQELYLKKKNELDWLVESTGQ